MERLAPLPLWAGSRCRIPLAGSLLFRTTHGRWRSLVAHQTGGLGVAGSSPARPTRSEQGKRTGRAAAAEEIGSSRRLS